MFSLAYVVNLFTNEFACLSTGRFSFPCVFMSPFNGLLLRHETS